MHRALVALAAGLFASHVVVLALPDSISWVPAVSDAIPYIVPLVTFGVCMFVRRRCDPTESAFWTFLGMGSLCWAIGDIGFSVYAAFDYDPAGTLSGADAGYLMLIPLWGAALVVHPARSRRGIERVGVSVDALVVLAIAATVTTSYVLLPALKDSTNLAGTIVSLAYPIGDLGLLAVLLSIRARSADRMRIADVLIVGAAVTFVIGDIIYARLIIVDTYDVGHPVDLFWTGAFVLVAIAAGRRLSASNGQDERRSSVPLLAIIGMAGMAGLAVLASVNRLRDVAIVTGVAATGLLLVVRLAVLLVDRANLVRALDAKVGELQQAHSARERFIATVSHDLRSPLASISGFAELLREPDIMQDPVQVDQMTSSIERNARRLARLTEDLLCAGQFAAGHPPPLKLASVDLRQTAEEVVGDMGHKDRVTVTGPHWTYAMADRQRVQQVLVNLVENAFKHSGSKDVSITIGCEDEGVSFVVSDLGIGIAPERIDQIFDPFVSDFARPSSAGLGLYVVTNLVAAMDGRISVTSELNHGSSFRVVLPAAVTESAVAGSASVVL